MTALAKIHILKKQACLDDDSYRDLLERETGKRSSKDLNLDQRLKVITALSDLVPSQEATVTGKYGRKMQALWIAGWNLGVIRDRSDKAMISFLRRQTGLDHHRFLRDAGDANKAIDALKSMIRRSTGNSGLFTRDRLMPPLYNDHRFQICLHIWAELIKLDAAPAGTLTAYLSSHTGHDTPEHLTDRQWIDVQNHLGKTFREARQ